MPSLPPVYWLEGVVVFAINRPCLALYTSGLLNGWPLTLSLNIKTNFHPTILSSLTLVHYPVPPNKNFLGFFLLAQLTMADRDRERGRESPARRREFRERDDKEREREREDRGREREDRYYDRRDRERERGRDRDARERERRERSVDNEEEVEPGRAVFVGNIEQYCRVGDLEDLFSQKGAVKRVGKNCGQVF